MSPADQTTYDVFVSYRQQDPDQTWVRELLVPALDEASLVTCVDYRSFRLGDAILTSMAEAVLCSRYTIAVMSPRYFASDFTELERIMAQHLGLEQGQRRLIGLMLEPCQTPLELKPYLWLDVSSVTRAASPELAQLFTTLRDQRT
jgi:TIR domain